VLTGARQTGKTTLARHSFADYAYLAIDDSVQSANLMKPTFSQWQTLYPYAVLDEIQKESRLINSIKATYDRFPNIRYLLLGSNQFLLMEKVKYNINISLRDFEIIAANGRDFALNHYSPKKVAERLLETCNI
jgi:predicted AAA+ superfamily ATPase